MHAQLVTLLCLVPCTRLALPFFSAFRHSSSRPLQALGFSHSLADSHSPSPLLYVAGVCMAHASLSRHLRQLAVFVIPASFVFISCCLQSSFHLKLGSCLLPVMAVLFCFHRRRQSSSLPSPASTFRLPALCCCVSRQQSSKSPQAYCSSTLPAALCSSSHPSSILPSSLPRSQFFTSSPRSPSSLQTATSSSASQHTATASALQLLP